MKKILILFITLSFVFVTASCLPKRDSPDSVELNDRSFYETDGELNSDEHFADPYIKVLQGEKYLLKCIPITETVFDLPADIEYSLARDSNRLVISFDQNIIIGNRFLLQGNKVYAINDKEKAVLMVGEDTMKDIQDSVPKSSEMIYTADGTDMFLNQELAYEEYTSADRIIRFYFDGKTLVGLEEFSNGDKKNALKILELTDQVPAEIFDIPSDYQITDLSDSDE